MITRWSSDGLHLNSAGTPQGLHKDWRWIIIALTTWTPQGLLRDSTWTPRGLFKDDLLDGTLKDSMWTLQGLHMDSVRTPQGLKVNYHGTLYRTLYWAPHWFPHGLHQNSTVFSLVLSRLIHSWLDVIHQIFYLRLCPLHERLSLSRGSCGSPQGVHGL